MTTTHDRTTSHELEREADANRAQLSETLDELRYMLTPGQITEELFSFARTSGASLLRSLGNAAVQNPIPTLLIGAGCAMFLSGSGRRAYRHEHWTGGQPSRGTVGGASESSFTTAARGATEALGRAAQSAGSAAASAGAGIRDAASEVAQRTASLAGDVKHGVYSAGETMADTAASMRETMTGTAASLRDTVTGTAASVGETMSGAAQEVRQGAADVGTRMRDYSTSVAATASAEAARMSGQIRQKAATFLEEQPVVVAALGVALGAVLGAALPSTETEDRLLGERSDAVKKQAGEIASESYETGKTILRHTVDEAKIAAAAEGLTAEKASEAARDIGDKVKRVVSGVSESLQEDLSVEARSPDREAAGNMGDKAKRGM